MSMMYAEIKETEMKVILRRINFLIKDRGYTAVEVGSLLKPGSGPNLISKWNLKEQRISMEEMILLVEILDTTLDYLLFGKGSPMKRTKLYAEELSMEEKTLLENYLSMTVSEQAYFMDRLKGALPKNTFFQTHTMEYLQKFRKEKDILTGENLDTVWSDLKWRLGVNLKQCLKERKMRQRELSLLTDVDPALISKYVKGQRSISMDKLILFCRILQIYPSELLLDYESPERIAGMKKDVSDVIVYYRMLQVQEKGQMQALSRMLMLGLKVYE